MYVAYLSATQACGVTEKLLQYSQLTVKAFLTYTISLCSPGPGLVTILQTASFSFGACDVHVIFSLNLILGSYIESVPKSCCFFCPSPHTLLPVCLHFPIAFPRACCAQHSEVPEHHRQMPLQAQVPFTQELASLCQWAPAHRWLPGRHPGTAHNRGAIAGKGWKGFPG